MTLAIRSFIVACVGLAACAGSSSDSNHAAATGGPPEENSGQQGTGVGVATAGPIVPVGSGSAASQVHSNCPRTGLWAACSVENRLTRAGFVVRRTGPGARRAGFSIPPQVYSLGRSRLEVFIYPTVSAANADVRAIDTTLAGPRGAPNAWGMSPTFVRSANLVAVFLTESPIQAERLTLALTAGAPQP